MDQRTTKALEKIERAQRLVARAAEDICSVAALADEWQATLELHDQIKAHWHRVSSRVDEIAREPWREP